MKVLITGITGFLGTNLALYLAKRHEVIGLDIDVENVRSRELEDLDLDLYEINILEYPLLESLITSFKPDTIIHLAGQVSHFKSQEDPYSDLEVNVNGILNLLEIIRENPRIHLIFASSRSVYGLPKYLPIDESHPINPLDAYGVSKRTCELYCQLYTYHYGINTTSFRQANLFGPRQQVWTSEFQMISWIFRCVALNEEFTFFGDGTQTRDFLYIDDCCKAYELAMLNPMKVYGEIFNLGGHEYCSWNQVIKYAEEVTGNKAKVQYIPHSDLRLALENPHSWLSYSKIKRALNWMPLIGVKEGFTRMYQYFIKEKKIHEYLK